jgi:phosphomannomutase
MTTDKLMVSVSGVRGRVGAGLTPEVITGFAAGFGAWAAGRVTDTGARTGGRAAVVVGRDSRVSGPMFHRAAIAGLQSVGCDVIDVGVVPTPTVQLAVEFHHAAGGLAITASHNPIDWNALKFIAPSGLFLSADEGASMRDATSRGVVHATWDRLGEVRNDPDAVARHLDAILALPYLDVEAIRRRRLHVALDCVRGAGSIIMLAVLERLGCRVSAINLEADGRFPHPPEPIAANLGDLEALVRGTSADVGFAVDPDVDRLALIDEQGRAIGEDYTLALAASVVLRRRPGPVVTNLSTSRIVDDIANEVGVPVIRAPVGEVNVALRMRAEGSPVGGEGNGGVIVAELHLGRDAPAGAALILQLLTDAGGATLSAITGRWPRYAIVKDKLDRPSGSLDRIYDTLRSAFRGAGVDLQDGLRLTWPDSWLHVRPSGTEPIVRVIAEAPTEARARELVAQARAPLDAMQSVR